MPFNLDVLRLAKSPPMRIMIPVKIWSNLQVFQLRGVTEYTFTVPLIRVYKMRVERIDPNKCAEYTIDQTTSTTISLSLSVLSASKDRSSKISSLRFRS